MLRTLVSALLALTAAVQAHAAVTAEKFSWENSGRFFLNINVDGKAMELRGNVRPGETVEVTSGPINAEVKSYAAERDGDAAISVILTSEGNDIAQVILIQGDKSLEILTPTAIPDRKATVSKDLEAVISYLKDRKGWNALAAFQWVRDWNNAAPGKSLFQFVDRVETDDIQVPRPMPRTADDSVARQRWDNTRRAEIERQIRRGQRPPPGPYGMARGPMGYGYPPPQGYGYGGYGQQGYGYPPPPPQQSSLGRIYGNN